MAFPETSESWPCRKIGLAETVLASLSPRQVKRKLEILRMETPILVRVIRVDALADADDM